VSKVNDGGPAFPRPASEWIENGTLREGNDALPEQDGMMLRDWFAGHALAGHLAWSPTDCSEQGKAVDAAAFAYKVADAMIAEREKASRP
jgi:hypothetical protein